MNMFSDDNTPDDVTPESLLESFQSSSKSELVGNSIGDAMYALYTADAVCFDVDSTVINEEGIDVLADFLGKGEEVAALTAAAMDGGMKFEDALKARLDLLEPSRQQILDCLEAHPLELTPGIEELVQALHAKNVDVFLVSGGFRIMIEPLAEILNIPSDTNIVANTINFEYGTEGKYAGFDANEPTSQDMGKPKALEGIQADHPNYETIVMVGDGATDAQAKPPAQAFIGFGGVVVREPVKKKSDWFVTSFDDMTKIVEMRK
jgi:phosphoserine phosphatase